ncbi:NADPH-dependent oxidoreductase [Actinomadura darangshiensis]|uniref:NADPH-dependent oxidoreductase n=1 Tax=Actinomadura darangshiensis TaxID=705336 RepID=A0A4R5A4L5_9ACTN|nr:NAD(P)H-dependent oxidoreductase [Actinomadura darangshiensis]TDD66873.1 NADPH-dependent oxidoreductase [Actinomadura darangshiensis]
MKLVIIIGSVRQGRYGPRIARWFADRAAEHDRFEIDVLDIADAVLPPALPPSGAALRDVASRPAEQRALAGRLAAADAFVVVTPEYNHSFPAALKLLIDWHFTEWQAKPVGFVSYGSRGGGLRATEQLRPVFAELHAATVRDSVSFDHHSERFDDTGVLSDPERPDAAAKVLLDQLAWWATALSEARAARPYPEGPTRPPGVPAADGRGTSGLPSGVPAERR